MDMEDLSVICAGLGEAEEDEDGNRIGYSKGESCLDNLRDLLRFLRRDDPQTRDVFKLVGKWNIVAKDLIPMIEHCQDDRNLVLHAVKILVFLTMPIEFGSSDISQQIEYLWGLKSSITCSHVVAVIVSLLESPLENLECEAFTEEDWKMVQLVLTLFRNVLAVQEIPMQQKAGASASQFLSLRDRFLELLFRENVMDLILAITQHVDGSCSYLRQDNLLLLEIFHYIFVGQEPELIAKAHLKANKEDKDTEASVNCLKSLMKEEQKSRLCRLRDMGRHSQFGGTFTRLTLDGSKVVFKGKPASGSCDPLLKPLKVCRGPRKKIPWDHARLPSTETKILQLLHDFVSQFLSGSYNVLMQLIREAIEKEHHEIQNSDVVVFFQVTQFATSFQYHRFSTPEPTESDTKEAFTDKCADSTFFRGDICGPVAASMNESMFQLVLSKWRYAFDGLKETNDYKFLSAAGSLMKNMIRMLDLVLKLLPEDSKEPQTARIILYKLFYDQTDEGMTQFLLNLIKSFDTHKQPKSDLADLIEMICKVTRLIENLQARGTLRVSRKSRKGRKSLSSNDKDNKELEDHVIIENEIEISNGERSTISSVNKNSDLSKTGCDGKEDITTPALAHEPGITASGMERLQGNISQMENRSGDNAYTTADSSGDEELTATCEVDFKVSSLISTLANNNIIQKVCWLLKFYKTNSTSTNNYIICILRRISNDLELSPMLDQLSILTTFYDILADQKSSPCQESANMVDFLTSLVRKMLRKMKNQPLLFVEVLFWKTRRECHYINAEYLLHELGCWKKDSRKYDDVSHDSENGSSMGQRTHRSIADALGEDEADVVIHHELGNENETTGEEHGGLASGFDGEINGREHNDKGESMDHKAESVPTRNKRLVLDGTLEGKIKDLYEKFKDDRNCSRLIAEVLEPDGKVSPAQISNKLKQMGLNVSHRKRIQNADEPFPSDVNQLEADSTVVERDSIHDSSGLGESLLSRPLHKRKRVRAFNEVQEAKIRALYEQFKDHKRCSYMIANSLDADEKFTAAQVSQKLKQLGLRISHPKRSEDNLKLRDGDLNDFSAHKERDSDDEMLSSLINRRKKKNGKLLVKESPGQTNEGNIAQESDEEIRSLILRKSRNPLPKSKENRLPAISTQETTNERSSEHLAIERITPWEVNNQDHVSEPMDTGEEVPFSIDGLNNSAETVFKGTGSGNQEVHSLELEDSGDEMVSSAYQPSGTSRRKLRMVVDYEDDD